MAGIACREYGFLIPGKVNAGESAEYIISHAVGDSGHGRSLWQIDNRSYPDFVNSHPLADHRAYIIKCIEVLKEKEQSLISAGFTRDKMSDYDYEMAIICSYNCGQGNVIRSLRNGHDPNEHTFSKDYGKCVMEYRYIYSQKYPNIDNSQEGLENNIADS